MQAVVLAAGTGTRLSPLTTTVPKALIPVANRPLLDYVVDSIKRAGIRRVVVVTGYLGSRIREYLRSTERYGDIEIDSIYAPNYSAGSLYSLLASEEVVEDNFLLAPADLILGHQIISKLVRSHTQRGTVDIMISELDSEVYERTCIASCKRRGSSSGTALQFVEPEMISEKISVKAIIGTAVGVVICPKEVFEYGHIAARNGSSKAIDALNRYIADRGKVEYMKVGSKEDWFDVDTIHTLLEANNHILRNAMVDEKNDRFYAPNTQSHSGSETTSDPSSVARVLGPTIIGEHCIIGEKSKIGPYVSIQDNCVIGRYVSCSNTIVLSGSRIEDDSAIENAVVRGQEVIMAAKPSHETRSSS